MSLRAPLVLFAALSLLPACTSYEAIDLRSYLEQQQFPITQGAIPADCDTVGMTVVQDSGFYLFGIIPIVPMRLEACVRALVREAKKLDADGVAEVRLEYKPPSFVLLSATFLTDWFGALKVSGSAWRRHAK